MIDPRFKRRVRESFNASAHRYHRHADYQRAVATQLADRIADATPMGPILDLGCGAGSLVTLLTERKVAVSVGVDLAHRMAHRAADDTGVATCQGDAESLPFADGSFRTVVSSLMLQWVEDLPGCFGEIARVLAPGGRFHAATLGPATLHEMRQVMDATLASRQLPPATYHPYPPVDQLANTLADAGFVDIEVVSRPDRWSYADPYALLRALKGVGAQNGPGLPVSGLGGRKVMEQFARSYAERCSDPLGVVATYETMFVTATRP